MAGMVLAYQGMAAEIRNDKYNTSGINTGHGKIIITYLGHGNEAPVISQGTGPISKVTTEDTLTTWSVSELNATDSDTNSSQLSWSLYYAVLSTVLQ